MNSPLLAMLGALLYAAVPPTGPTTPFDQAVTEHRSFVAAEKRKIEEELRSDVTATIVSVAPVALEDGTAGLRAELRLRNNTERGISRLQGALEVVDRFGTRVGALAMTYDAALPPGGFGSWINTLPAPFVVVNESDARPGGLAKRGYKVVWRPLLIVFADGTKLTLETSKVTLSP